MRERFVLSLVLLLSFSGPTVSAQTQQSSNDGGRKVVRKVEPKYPELAKRINLAGTVKVVALVSADGNVRKVEPVGGSPILVEAAATAISQWKYVTGSETREVIELHFNP